MRQEWLWSWENPLRGEQWKSFFMELPELCGVYQFKTHDGRVLYVGQSKNLKQRLKSYRYIHPERSPRKLLRLVHEVASIDFEVCENEEKTRALEAKRIHELRPKRNRAFTHPESHRYLEFRLLEQDRWQWRITIEPVDQQQNTRVFGAFSGTAIRQMLASIRRIEHFHKRKSLTQVDTPLGFFDAMVPDRSEIDLSLEPNLTQKECERLVRKVIEFLEGKSDSWLHRIYGKSGQCILQCTDPWIRNRWLQDFEQLKRFYKFQSRRNREYASKFPVSRKEPIGAQQLDILKARAYGA